MTAIFPFIEWFKTYKKEYIRPDLIAGLTVGMVLVPQSMAYAMLAGLPPVYGLYAAAITPIIGALWGKSGLLAVGPLALVSLLTAAALAPFAEKESPEYIAMAILLAFMVGIIFLLMGIFKLGFLFRFISYPVIVGILSAIAIIIALSQVRHIFGIDVARTEFIYQMFVEIWLNIGYANLYTAAIALLSFAILYGGTKIHNVFPGALVAAIVTTALAYWLDLRELGVRTVGDMPAGLPMPALPYINIDLILSLLSSALVIAIIGFVQVVALTKVISARTERKADLDQELTGHGAANLVGSFFHSYPITSSASRTAVNLQVGGKTGISIIISGIFVIFTVLFLTPLFYYLPRATLGAIVFVAGISMIQYNPLIKVYKTSKLDGSVALITFLLALILKPDYAVFIAIAISLILFLRSSINTRVSVLARNPQTETFEDAEASNLQSCPQILYLRPDAAIFFANAGHIRDSIFNRATEQKNGLKYVLLDFDAVSSLDTTGVDELTSLIKDLRQFGIELYVVNANDAVKAVLNNSGLMNLLGHKCCPTSKGESIALLFNKIDHQFCRNTCKFSIFTECKTVK